MLEFDAALSTVVEVKEKHSLLKTCFSRRSPMGRSPPTC